MQQLKEKTSYKLLSEFPHLRKAFWGTHLWAGSSGKVTDEIVKQYIANQDLTRDDDFRVGGGPAAERSSSVSGG